MALANTQSTYSLQDMLDAAMCYGDIRPTLIVAGFENTQSFVIARDVMNAICALPFPHKWNEKKLVPFYTNSSQQDYALVNTDGSSVLDMSWLERGMAVDINNDAVPKPFRYVECGRQLPQQTGTLYAGRFSNPLYLANWFPNYMLYYGTWGQATTGNATFGNNPVAGSVYTNPLVPNGASPSNPITQIQDANGNLLVLTTYGTEGSAAPLAAVDSPAGVVCSGAGASTVWTVVDPNGAGIRLSPPPPQSGTVWQLNLVYQKKPVRFTVMGQTLDPLPDEFEPHFRDGFIAQCYKYSSEKSVAAKFKDMWTLWLQSLNSLRQKEDREPEENVFVPERGILPGRGGRSGYLGPQYPFNY